MKVTLPSPLLGYTANRRQVEAEGATLAELLADLDRRYPGIRFRMIDEQGAVRPHIRLFVNRSLERSIDAAIQPGDEVLVVAALSGG